MSFNLNTYLIIGGFLINFATATGSYFNALSDIRQESSKALYIALEKQREINKNEFVSKEEFIAYKSILVDLNQELKNFIYKKHAN